MNTPPTICIAVGSWPSSSQANTMANSTSARPANEASLAPRRRAAPMPATYGTTEEIRASPTTGSTQLTWWFSTVTGPVRTVIGTRPVQPSTARAALPVHIAAQVIAIGGSGSGGAWLMPPVLELRGAWPVAAEIRK